VKRRRSDPRRAKIHRNYDVAELAKLFGVCRGTVREWIRRGLKPMNDDRRPALFLGSEVRRFLLEERKSRKRAASAGQIFCFQCRVPRVPADNEADYRPRTLTSGNLEGICAVCGTMMYRAVARARLDAIRCNLQVKFLEAHLRISTRPAPSLNPDSEAQTAPHAKALP
jgi:Helix-turn-helix domain